jgi:hypothetical protein
MRSLWIVGLTATLAGCSLPIEAGLISNQRRPLNIPLASKVAYVPVCQITFSR